MGSLEHVAMAYPEGVLNNPQQEAVLRMHIISRKSVANRGKCECKRRPSTTGGTVRK